MDLAAHFGIAVRKHRELLKLSQDDLADRSGLDRTYISGVERGVRNPTLQVMQRLSEALGEDLDAIFTTARRCASEDES